MNPAGPRWPGGAAWIDGRYCPIEAAKISVLDLGVTRSDGTYDVAHVWGDSSSGWKRILTGSPASLARLRLDPGYDRDQIEGILHGCVRHVGLRHAYVSMTCARGRLAASSRDLRTVRPTFCWKPTTTEPAWCCCAIFPAASPKDPGTTCSPGWTGGG